MHTHTEFRDRRAYSVRMLSYWLIFLGFFYGISTFLKSSENVHQNFFPDDDLRLELVEND